MRSSRCCARGMFPWRRWRVSARVVWIRTRMRSRKSGWAIRTRMRGRMTMTECTRSVVAAKAVDEASVAFGRAFGWRGEVERTEEFAFFGGLAASLFAGLGLAVEGLGDGGGAALLAEGEDF